MLFWRNNSECDSLRPEGKKVWGVSRSDGGSGGQAVKNNVIAIDKNKKSAHIIDPTVRFEAGADQPVGVDVEKKRIY